MNTLQRSSTSAAPRAFHSSAEELGATLLKSGLVAFALVESGNIIAASPALRELLGSSTPYHHVDGQSLLSVVAQFDRTAVSDFCTSLLRDGMRSESQCHLLHADGSPLPVQLSAMAIFGEARTQLVVVVTDLTPWVGELPAGDAAKMLDAFDRATGFATRPLLMDRMRIALAAARRYRRRCALLRIDLERLDALLGGLEPAAAQEMQASVAETLRNCVRDCDTVARLSVREFVVLLPEIGQRDDGGITAARIVDAIATVCGQNPSKHRVAAAVGVAVYPTDGTSPERLMLAAEEAMRAVGGVAGGGFSLADATSAELAAIAPLEMRADFFVGVEQIDAEHRDLIARTNALVQGLRNGIDARILEADLRAVIDLLREHFASEARQLGVSPYEGSLDLRSRNLRFLDELHCILLHANAQSVTLAVRHLYDWLVPHLLQLDQKLATH